MHQTFGVEVERAVAEPRLCEGHVSAVRSEGIADRIRLRRGALAALAEARARRAREAVEVEAEARQKERYPTERVA